MEADDFIFAVMNAILYAKNFRLMRHYRRRYRRFPNIANPHTYAERMLWRKTVDHNPQFVIFSDKLATKEFLLERCPELPVPRTLWTGRDADEIPDEMLRGDVFVKANHGSNFNYRVRGNHCGRATLRQLAANWLASVYGQKNGEWGYHKVAPKLFVEAAVGDAGADLIEFNVRACNGRAILGSVLGKAKMPDQWAVYLDAAGNPTAGMSDSEGAPVTSLPENFTALEPYRRAVRFAECLSVGVDYARFDFLWNGTELFGGEITLYPAAGIEDPSNSLAHAVILNGWDLLQSHFLKSSHVGWARIYAAALRRRTSRNMVSVISPKISEEVLVP